MNRHFEDDPGAGSSTSRVPETSNTLNEQDLACSNLTELIAFNEAYREVVETSIACVTEQLRENRDKQKLMKEELRRASRSDVSKKKVPVNLYMPPYFKDEQGMCPPMSSEARAKKEKNWFDPLMKEEKKWTPAELKTLREAVRDSLVAHMLQPFCSKRDIVVYKLRHADINTTEPERMQWTMELEDIMRKIEYIRQKKEQDVLTPTADYTVVQWNEIANVNFKGTRTEWAVRSKWMNDMNPKWNKDPWTHEEIDKMKNLRESPRFISWPVLAMSLGTNRTAFQCLEKYKTEVSQQSREWTQEEDNKLITLTQLMTINGNIQWDKIAQFMPGRTRQQVRTRFSHTLDTSVKHGRWTDQEDLLLMCAVSRYGARDWAKVAHAVPGRNDSQCRERWCNVLNRPANITERFTLAEDEQLLYAVKVFGKGNWAKCATLLPKKTSRQLRRRYIQLIAAKLKMVAGFCNAVDAMSKGRKKEKFVKMREANKKIVNVDDIEDEPNDLMRGTYDKFSKLGPGQEESIEEFRNRVNDTESSNRIKKLRESSDWPTIRRNLQIIQKKHQRSVDEEKRARDVLKSLNITDIDIRYMFERSTNLEKYYLARRNQRNVDQSGCRVRPINISLDQNIPVTFDHHVPENERCMCLVEALCETVRKHDIHQWGKTFWHKNQHFAARSVKDYMKDMLIKRAEEVVVQNEQVDEVSHTLQYSLPPQVASVNMMETVTKARAGLNQLASKHFYPIDLPIQDQDTFTTEKREQLDSNVRLNVKLSEEIESSKQFKLFKVHMRMLLLEPYRLKLARETAEEERVRLERAMVSEMRNVEEETVQNGSIERPTVMDNDTTPESIQKLLDDGIEIDVSDLTSHESERVAYKNQIQDTIDKVADSAKDGDEMNDDESDYESSDEEEEQEEEEQVVSKERKSHPATKKK